MRSLLAAAFALASAASAHAQPPDDSWPSYRAHIAAAESAMRLEEPGRARQWLDAAPQSHRGWEHNFLSATLDTSLATLATLPDVVMSVSLSPDGATLAAGVSSGEIVLINTSDRSIARRWDAHKQGGLFRVAFSPDGKQIASSGADRKAIVWSTTGESKTTFDAHKFPVGGLAWSPDGLRIATSAYYTDKSCPVTGRIHTWNPATGEIDQTMNFGVKPVVYLNWSRDGSTLAAGTWDTHVWLFNPATGKELRKCVEPREGGDFHTDVVAISPDGSLLAVGSDIDWVHIYRTADCTRVAELLDHHADVFALAFSADGKTLATGAADCTIRLWSVGEGSDFKLQATLRGHTAAIRSLAFSPDGARLYSGAADKTAHQWDTSHRNYTPVTFKHTKAGYACTFSPDGQTIAGAGYDGQLILWDAATGKPAAHADAHGKSPNCHSAFSPDGKTIATCSWDKSVRTFDAETLQPIRTINLDAGVAWCVFSPDGKHILASLTNKTAAIVSAETGEKLRLLEGHTGRVEQAAYSPDGARIATASDALRVFDAATGALLGTSPPARTLTCAFSPDGTLLASGTETGEMRTHDPRTAAPIRTLLEVDRPVYRIAFAPDGKRLAAGAIDLFILDPSRPGEAIRLKPLKETIWDLNFSPDGKRLAVVAWDGSGSILAAPDPRGR